MQYQSRINGASICSFLLDYRDAQADENYDRVGKLLSVRNVNKYGKLLDIQREIAFHRETGNSITEELAIHLLKDLEERSILYDVVYIKNILHTLHKKVHIEELSIEVRPYVYLEVYFTFSHIVKYLYVNPYIIEKELPCMVLGDGIKQLEAQEAFVKLLEKMEER